MSNPNGHLSIRTSGSPDDLLQLLDWFGHDDGLRGRVRLESPTVQDGQMGDLSQVLVVALGSGGIATALASALKTWFTTRQSDIAVILSRPDGTELKVDAKRVDSHEVLSDLKALIEPQDAAQ